MAKKEKSITIKIDKETQSEFIDIDNMIRKLHGDMQLMCNMYIRINGHTGKDFEFQKLESPGSNKVIYSLGADVVIHPKSSLLIALVSFQIGERQQEIKDIVIDAEIMAEDIRTVEEKKVVSGKEIKSRVVPNNT